VLHFGQSPDAEDAFQETFLKYATHQGSFNDAEHRKAWLLRVAINTCRDMLKAAHRKDSPLQDAPPAAEPISQDSITQPGSPLRDALVAVLDLGDPPRTAVYLALCEGYSAPQIAGMLGVPTGTVYSWISRGRKTLREVLA
jgi:RNA polymerase sigma-70 factor (ECF subfamily)